MVIVIGGPTASGKTALAARVARTDTRRSTQESAWTLLSAHALIKAAFLNQVFVAIDGDGVVATGGLPLGSRPSDV